MQQLQGLSFAKKLILGGAVLLLIDTFLDWQQVSAEVFGGEVTIGQSAWHGFWGVMLGLLTILLVVWVLARAFNVQLPEGQPEALIALAVAAVILLFAVIKVIADEAVHWPAYVGIVLAAVIAYGAWMNFQESGEQLPARMRAMGAGPATTAPTAPNAPADAPAPSEPAAPDEPAPPPGEPGEPEPPPRRDEPS